MKKRIISLLLVLSMMIGMVPMFGVNVGAVSTDSRYYVADDMTEAEAFAAGLDVFIAWYNYHNAYRDIVTSPIEAKFNDYESAFNKLYSQIYPNGADSDKGRSVLAEAQRWVEDAYDGVDQFSQIESDIMMSILLSCFLYTGNEDDNSAGDVEETFAVIQDATFLGYDISNFSMMQQLLDKSTKFSGKLSPLEFLAEQGEELKTKGQFGKLGFDVLLTIVKEVALTRQEKKDAISKAAQYDTIKSVSASEIDILREYESHGFIGDYVKLYTKAYDESLESGESSLKDALLSQTGNHNDMIIDLSATAITTSASAVAAGTASSVALGAGVIAAGVGGFVLFNILEGVWKLGGDLLFGQDAMKSADITLFYLGWVRDLFYNGYKDAYRKFGYYPTQENAQRLNTYSKLMYRIFAASEMYASQLNNTYATAGALNAEWMHYIAGKIDPKLTAIAKTQSESMIQQRKQYLNNAFDAYSSFCDNSVYRIELNLTGGSYSLPEAFGLGGEKIVLSKIKTIGTTIPEGIPVRSGYKFVGWTTDPSATTGDSKYAPGSTYSQNADLTLYAVWQKVYTISYNDNGGTGAPNAQENTEGNTTLSTKVPARSGYTFLGWDENKDAKTPTYKYEAGKSMVLTKDGDVKLYAIWQKNPIITYHANGGSSAPASHENKGVLSKTWPQWTGHTFKGWSVKNTYQEGDQLYAPGASIPITGDITLYAIWTTDPYVVKYDYNDGTPIIPEDIISVPVTDKTIYKIGDTKKNKESFKGWMYQNPNGEYQWTNGVWDNGKVSVIQPGQTIELTGNLVLYAKWDYYVHYHSNGTVSHEVVRDGADYVIDAPVSTESGKVFKYWKFVDANGKESTYNVGDTIDLTEDLSLSAVWGTAATTGTTLTTTTDQISYKPGDTVKLSITADNSGYFCVDVSENSGFKLKDANGSKTSKAVFVEKKSNSDANTLKCYNNGSVYIAEIFIPSSCADGSYPVKITASNGVYSTSMGGSVSGTESSTAVETVTIKVDTSVEEGNSYTLSYHPNHGYGSVPDPVRFKEDDNVLIASKNSLVRDGYTFEGWSAREDGRGKVYVPGKSYKFTGDTMLYAIWKIDPKYDMPEELEISVSPDRYKSKTGVSWYKPGDVIGLRINIDNSDHLYVDVRNCPGFTFISRDGYETKEGTFYEASSPDCKGKTTYTDGAIFYVSIKIPSTCRDGEYAIIVKGADGRVDPTTGESHSKILTVGSTITVRKSETPDEIHLNQTELTLHKDDSTRLNATMFPKYITEGYRSSAQFKPYVAWKASNTSVVEIDDSGNDAKIKGKATGTATVTAEIDGVSVSCIVTVVNCDYSVKIVDLDYLASPATCKEQATYYYVCSCGETGNNTYKAGSLVPHSYSTWTTTTEPSEYTAGLKERTCSTCGDVESETIPTTGHTHTFGLEWSNDSSSHWHECACGDKADYAEHCFDSDTDKDCICGYVRQLLPVMFHWYDGTCFAVLTGEPDCLVLIAYYQNDQLAFTVFLDEQTPYAAVYADEAKAFFLDKTTYAPVQAALETAK